MTLPKFSITHNFLSLIKKYNIPVVNIYNTLNLDHINNLVNQEGVVVRFNDGHCIKIKGSWYVDLHKTKEAIQSERFVIKMIFSKQIDDILPKLQETDKKRLSEYNSMVLQAFIERTIDIQKIANEIISSMDRKTFALTQSKQYANHINTFIFKKYDNKDLSAMEYFEKLLVEKSNSNKNLEPLRSLYKYLKWDDVNV